MEHRCSERWPLVLPALLRRQGYPITIGRTRNIGREGLFIETDPAEFSRNVCLDVVLVYRNGKGARRLRLSIVVAHCATDGIGVMFRSLSADAERALRALEYQAARTGTTPMLASFY